MKVKAYVSKVEETVVEVDDKFGILTNDKFWEKHWKEAFDLTQELIKEVRFSEDDISEVFDIYDLDGNRMAEN